MQVSMGTSGAATMQSPRIRRHTMVPNHSSTSTIESGTSPPRGQGGYGSSPERAIVPGGVDIKKKPRAMSEMTSEVSGGMICEICGKGYKHASCLSKHRYVSGRLWLILIEMIRWEHSPHWSQTSKLLISKHQQVQLLEAAQILVHMNRSDSSLSTASAGDRIKIDGYNYPVVFEDEDDIIMDETQKTPVEDEEMFGMDDD